MDRQTLRDWVLRYNEAGANGLMSRSAPGRQAELTPAQMQNCTPWSSPVPTRRSITLVRWRCIDLRERWRAAPM